MTTGKLTQIGFRTAMAAFLFSQLLACGGGGGNFADGGIGGSGVTSAGVVTSKGSIFVNGIEYSVAGATYNRDGLLETLTENEQSIQVGMNLEVKGVLNQDGRSGQAQEILFKDLVEGPIEAIASNSAGIKVLTILAQQVVVEEGHTNFNPGQSLNFSTLETETGILEVSGFRRADGIILASYIERKNPLEGRNELVGAISTIIDTNSFTIGALTVTGNNQAALQVGDLVKARGNYAPVTQTLAATEVSQLSPGLSVQDQDDAEVEGFVSGGVGAFQAGLTFQVDGQNTQYSANTEFSGGGAADLANNMIIEVEGPLVGGILMAEKIEFKETLKLEAPVTGITGNSLTLTFPDALAAAGTRDVEVVIDPAVAEEETPFGEIALNDYVEIEGRQSTSGSVLATRIQKLSSETSLTLQAPVESFNTATGELTLLNIVIDTSGFADTQFTASDQSDPIGRSAFFTALQTGSSTLVKAQGEQPGQWSSVELEH